MSDKVFEQECERVIQQLRYERQMQKKRLYESAKRQRQSEAEAKRVK
jgi:hypothetical protein